MVLNPGKGLDDAGVGPHLLRSGLTGEHRDKYGKKVTYVDLDTGSPRRKPRLLPLLWGSLGCCTAVAGSVAMVFTLYAFVLLWKSDEYDCDGDGVSECGVWDYGLGMCANKARCGRFQRLADISLGQSCRCRKCSDPAFAGTAYGDRLLKESTSDSPFDALSWGTFRNWGDHIESCAPWLMPRDEASMASLLNYSKVKGYKVRVGGTGHSSGGLITDGEDNQVVVASLGEFTSIDQEWEFDLKIMADGSARASINAGWTLLQLFAAVRPHGYFLPTVTAGYYFSLGGIVANSVHGGGYNAGFIYSYVTRMRVMLHDGEIRIIDSQDELKYWRGSLGLLGIILGIEFQLEKRTELEMYTVSKTLKEWSSEEVWKFIKQDAEADVPANIVPEGGNGTRASWNAQFFVDFVNGGSQPNILAYAQKTNTSIDSDFAGQLEMPADVVQRYSDLLEVPVSLDEHGAMSYKTAARRDGSPPLVMAGLDLNKVLSALNWLPLARAMSWSAMIGLPMFVRDLSGKINDGFMQARTPAALAAAFYFEPQDAFRALSFLRDVQQESLSSSEFVWNLPAEFRFINVTDVAVLQPVSPGLHIAIEMLSFEDLSRNEQAWKRDFKRVEEFWVDRMGSTPHLGKIWGFGETHDGRTEPFQRARSCKIFSDGQKAVFEAYRANMDPHNLFLSGLGLDLLSPCPIRHQIDSAAAREAAASEK